MQENGFVIKNYVKTDLKQKQKTKKGYYCFIIR